MNELTEHKKAEINQIFAILDVDGSGFLTARTLSEMMRAFGYDNTEQEVQLMIDILDTEGTGMMNCSMFSAALLWKPDLIFIQEPEEEA